MQATTAALAWTSQDFDVNADQGERCARLQVSSGPLEPRHAAAVMTSTNPSAKPVR